MPKYAQGLWGNDVRTLYHVLVAINFVLVYAPSYTVGYVVAMRANQYELKIVCADRVGGTVWNVAFSTKFADAFLGRSTDVLHLRISSFHRTCVYGIDI